MSKETKTVGGKMKIAASAESVSAQIVRYCTEQMMLGAIRVLAKARRQFPDVDPDVVADAHNIARQATKALVTVDKSDARDAVSLQLEQLLERARAEDDVEGAARILDRIVKLHGLSEVEETRTYHVWSVQYGDEDPQES